MHLSTNCKAFNQQNAPHANPCCSPNISLLISTFQDVRSCEASSVVKNYQNIGPVAVQSKIKLFTCGACTSIISCLQGLSESESCRTDPLTDFKSICIEILSLPREIMGLNSIFCKYEFIFYPHFVMLLQVFTSSIAATTSSISRRN